ncbi:MAG TPA: hypothetical protein VIY90_15680 [Steroidobacteraceae bacterium]
MNANATSSNGVNSSAPESSATLNTRIEQLSGRVTDLAPKVDWWNSAILVMMVVAALAATGLVITQFIAFRRARNLSDIQFRLDDAKDLKIGLDLKTKDGEIAGAMSSAAEANDNAERLKQLVQWRTVDPANMKVLIAELAKGSGEIDLAFAPSDPETEYFALKIIGNDGFAAVNNSGNGLKWHVYLRQWVTNGLFFGISIPGPENDQVRFLRRAFSEAHIEFSTESPPEEVPPITVGNGLKFTPAPRHEALIVIGLRKPPL